MKLRKLTPRGISKFSELLLEARNGGNPDFSSLLQLPGLTLEYEHGIEIQPTPSRKKREVGKYLFETLAPIGDPNAVQQDAGLWSWLTLYWIDSLAPVRADGTRKIRANYYWIPETDNFQNYYRHFLALPFRAYAAYSSNPDAAAALFAGEIDVVGELTEQIASSQDIFANPALLETASKLYVEVPEDKLKAGAGGKGPGSPRRFAAIINQLVLTYDVSSIAPNKLMKLLPSEFDKFKP